MGPWPFDFWQLWSNSHSGHSNDFRVCRQQNLFPYIYIYIYSGWPQSDYVNFNHMIDFLSQFGFAFGEWNTVARCYKSYFFSRIQPLLLRIPGRHGQGVCSPRLCSAGQELCMRFWDGPKRDASHVYGGFTIIFSMNISKISPYFLNRSFLEVQTLLEQSLYENG